MALPLAPGHIHIFLFSMGNRTGWGIQRFHPPAVSSADGQDSVELLKGSFFTGPHTWAKNFLLDLGPTQNPRKLQATGVLGVADSQSHRKGPGPPPRLPRG